MFLLWMLPAAVSRTKATGTAVTGVACCSGGGGCCCCSCLDASLAMKKAGLLCSWLPLSSSWKQAGIDFDAEDKPDQTPKVLNS